MTNRIPAYHSARPDSMLTWFAEMSVRGLLFHPEEDPANIVRIEDGAPVFTRSEAKTIRKIMCCMHAEHGEDKMIEACYPVFMRAAGQRLDA